MQFFCLDPFNQAAFRNHFTELSSGTILLALQLFRLWDWLAQGSRFRKETRVPSVRFWMGSFVYLWNGHDYNFFFLFSVCLFVYIKLIYFPSHLKKTLRYSLGTFLFLDKSP